MTMTKHRVAEEKTIQYHTSLRSRPIAETLVYAKEYAKKYGITRVTNTTQLDNIGVPVYASIRPDAQEGSLCVSAGKGLRPEEAEIGAYMEALELAMAEPKAEKISVIKATVADVLDGQTRPNAILDFCPKQGFSFELNQPIDCVRAYNLQDQQTYLVPAELGFIPYSKKPYIFGSNSNGLASGNTLMEASLHGILEVIERDIMSFQMVQEDSKIILPESFPENVRQVYNKVKAAGHELILRYAANEFGWPFIIGSIIDGQTKEPMFINGGYGCHFFKNIAMMRAATEAIQSRLSFIHGGRDDLMKGFDLYNKLSWKLKTAMYEDLKKYITDDQAKIDYADIPEKNWRYDNMEGYLQRTLDFLKESGFPHVLRISYTQPEEPLQVLKMIIPKMEFFLNPKALKIGPRLNAYATKIAHRVCGPESHPTV